MPGAEQALELAPRPASAAVARAFVARALDGVSDQVREVSILLASELVTNALLYSDDPITVRVRTDDAQVRITVRDGNNQVVEPRRVGTHATSGRGLTLVDELASSWGVDLVVGAGKEVWFEVPRA